MPQSFHIDCGLNDPDKQRYVDDFAAKVKLVTSLEECEQLQESDGLGYMQWHDLAAWLVRNKQRQLRCATCLKVRFQYERCPLMLAKPMTADKQA